MKGVFTSVMEVVAHIIVSTYPNNGDHFGDV